MDYQNFKTAVADLDRRMASIVCQGYNDCSGLESAFKVTTNTVEMTDGCKDLLVFMFAQFAERRTANPGSNLINAASVLDKII